MFGRFFGNLALTLLKMCSKESQHKAKCLVATPITKWANKSLMELAGISRCKEFIAHPRCKEISKEKWRGNIEVAHGERNLSLKVNINLFKPLIS